MIIVADSGSTKTEWITERLSVTTKGINPVRDTYEEILCIINTELMPLLSSDSDKVTEIHFYGAGCIEPFLQSVQKALENTFTEAKVYVYSDLLGAARALCNKKEGIACILGTGSNSCLCKDGQIIQNVSPLGYILGDEGSGAVLGRKMLAEMLKGELKELWNSFYEEYQLEVAEVINKVYRQPQANRFLASIVPFIKKNLHHNAVKNLVVSEFSLFLKRNVIPYNRLDLPVNFVGGVANNFKEEIAKACKDNGLKLGNIIDRPTEEMLRFHLCVI